jgi:beta-glucosidase/6-phospho-beta-glucosidase/beta-galactosidase
MLSPESMYWGTRLLVDVWNAKEIFITENGLPTTASGDAEGYDTDRIVWLRAYLSELQRATAEGVPGRGPFHWSTSGAWASSQVRAVSRGCGHTEAKSEAERAVVSRAARRNAVV